jgi:branched-chain amino acid transport system ATP-binding protein
MAIILEVMNICKYFGGLVALDDLSFNVNSGEIVGIIGPNGAGKSTLFNVITGFISPTSGQVLYEGKKITGNKPHEIARRGIVRTFQLTVLFPEFTVLENVLIGRHLKSSTVRSLVSLQFFPPKELQKASEILEITGLTHLRDYQAGNLPHGYQRMLAVAIAVASDPKVLLLDEPVTGMNSEEIETMISLLKALPSAKGINLIVVEHNVKVIMDICQKIIAINFGRKICEGSPEEIRKNKDVIEAYLGKEYT